MVKIFTALPFWVRQLSFRKVERRLPLAAIYPLNRISDRLSSNPAYFYKTNINPDRKAVRS